MESLFSSYDDAKTTKVAKQISLFHKLGVAGIWSGKGFVLIAVRVFFFP